MSVTLINGDGNPRVLASQDADWYGALTGQKTCIVPINDNLSATITDSNTIEIGSGVCITKEGRRVQIDEGDIEEIIIPTGTQGVDTYYIIGFHLYINESGQQVAETFVETMASATDTITETTFKEGSSSIYVSLYRVHRSGLLMDGIERIIPIEAGGMANEIYAYNGMMGAKNLLGQPYYSGSSVGVFSVDSDGVLTINGTSTANAEYVFKANAQNWRLPTGKYKVSGISGGSASTYFMSVTISGVNTKYIYDGEVEIEVTSTDNIRIAVSVKSGQTLDNLQIFPMVRLASDTDTTFRPYAKTNKQLTDDVSQINNSLNEINSNLSVIGNKYQSTTLVATSIPATTDTTVLRLDNLPKGVYVVTGYIYASTTISNTGGIIEIRSTGNTTIPNTIQNSGFFMSGSITGVFEVMSSSNSFNVGVFCTNAQTLTSGGLTAIRIA